MSFYYKDTEQISSIESDKPYKFNLPIFGKSTTDPTYYEPSATRIANMRKSANSVPSLYDFTGENQPDISDTNVMIGRKPYFTQEEMSQFETTVTKNIKNDSESAKKDAKNKQEDIKNTLEIIESSREENNFTKEE